MQGTAVDINSLASSPLRQLYDVLTTFEQHRAWVTSTKDSLLQRASSESVDNFGVDPADIVKKPTLETILCQTTTIPNISRFSRASGGSSELSQARTTQLSSLGAIPAELVSSLSPRDLKKLAILQLFSELTAQRIESWGRVTRLVITQPMDDFTANEPLKEACSMYHGPGWERNCLCMRTI